MRRSAVVLTFLLLVACVSYCSALGIGKLGIGARGGVLQVQGDDIEGYGIGPAFGGHISFGIIPGLTAVGSFTYGWNEHDEVQDAKLVYMPIALGIQYDLSSFMPPGIMFVPGVGAGAGMYTWKSELEGESVKVGDEDLEGSDLGLYGELGVEFLPIPDLGIRPHVGFHYIFSADEDKFGAAWDSNSYLIAGGVGVTYYISIIPIP